MVQCSNVLPLIFLRNRILFVSTYVSLRKRWVLNLEIPIPTCIPCPSNFQEHDAKSTPEVYIKSNYLPLTATNSPKETRKQKHKEQSSTTHGPIHVHDHVLIYIYCAYKLRYVTKFSIFKRIQVYQDIFLKFSRLFFIELILMKQYETSTKEILGRHTMYYLLDLGIQMLIL